VSDERTCAQCRQLDGCEVRLALKEHFHIVPEVTFGCVHWEFRNDDVWFHDHHIACQFRRCLNNEEYAEFFSSKGAGMYFQISAYEMDMIARQWQKLRSDRRAVGS